MDKRVHYKTIQMLFKEKFNMDIDVKSFVNNVTGEIYDVVFEKETDIALFSRRDNDGFGDYICLNSNGDKIDEDKIFGYVNSAYTTYENGEIIFSERDLELHFKDENLSIEEMIKRETELFPERTGIILKTAGFERKAVWKELTNFYVDEIVYADEEEFKSIMGGNDSELIKDYNQRNYEQVQGNEVHGLLVINKNTGDGLMINPSGADYARYMSFAPQIEISARCMLEEKMKKEAIYELKLYAPMTVIETEDGIKEYQVDGREYFDDIKEAIDKTNGRENERCLANYLEQQNLKSKVYSITPGLTVENERMMTVIEIKLTKPLEYYEIEELKEFCSVQLMDAWGESSYFDGIRTDGTSLFVEFMSEKDDQIMTEEELSGPNEQETSLQMQGINEMRM